MTILSKSAYMKGQQCQRLLWFADRKQLPEVSLADQHKFDQGHDFEKYVYLLFPKAVDLSGTRGKENIEKTQEAIKNKKTIFEAGVQFEDLFVRSDIFEPVGDKWNLYEIKSTTEVKKQHIPDLAFQKYVLEKAGFKINKCFVIFLNKEYVKKGKIDAKKLICKEDVTEKVGMIDDIEENSQEYLETIKDECEPPIKITVNCNKPYPCALKEHCWGTLPTNNVLHLTNWRQYWKFFHSGIIDMKEIPKTEKLNSKDENIKKAHLSCKIVVDKEAIKHFMNTLKFPLYHFDFETFDTAVPIYDKSRPYQKIPFQYSLHIQHENGKLEHFEYLADGKEDPRLKLLEQLKGEIEGKGSVVVFNKSFEVMVLSKLAEDFPEHAEWVNKVLGRIVDLAVPFQNFHYYCPTQKGKYSIKKVLPAITGKGYENLEINNGGDASIMYFNSHIKNKEEVHDKLRQDLLNYCGLDTEGMVWIVDELKKLVN